MKKKIRVAVILGVFLIIIIPLISAESFDFENAKYQVTRVIDSILGISAPFLEKLIGDYRTSDFFFSKILLLILLIIISENILEKTPIGENNKKVSYIVAIIISILAIRFVSQNNFFESILIPYGALGIAITTFLPIIIFFYFINSTKIGTFGRKVFWIIYGIILLVIWLSRSSEMPETANWIYALSFLSTIIFVLFDRSIHSYFGAEEFNKFLRENSRESIKRERRKIVEANNDLNNGIITPAEHDQIVREARKRIVSLSKN
ncbi:MAG: hypothetical protein AABX30_00680 [Nanoarchaeota archaeon]